MTVNVETIRARLAAIDEKRRYYEWKSTQPGRLQLQESWRHAYLAYPYLIGALDSRVSERFGQIFINAMELTPQGKLGLVPMHETDLYMQVFTHMLEEYESRTGGLAPPTTIDAARAPLHRYFEYGTPIGVTMFEGYCAPTTPIVVKYGKREFLEPMLRAGELRLANASHYNEAGLLDAVRDDETSRTFFFPTYRERLKGRQSITIGAHTLPIGEDDIELPLVFDDYYLFSLCSHIHYRMPTDFGADAALVIRDPSRFKRRLIASFLARYPGWEAMEGPVTYYDPYRDYKKFKIPHMAKHFAYAYQKEVRVAFRSRKPIKGQIEPIFLSLGSMEDYAELVGI